jgi:hypothetical protein
MEEFPWEFLVNYLGGPLLGILGACSLCVMVGEMQIIHNYEEDRFWRNLDGFL